MAISNVDDLLQRHNLERTELGTYMKWSPATLSRKLRNQRAWTFEEVLEAAWWFRIHGVQVHGYDLAKLVKTG